MENTTSFLEIRLHGTDGKFESFMQEDPVLAEGILNEVQPARLFTLPKIVIAGTHSLSAFIPSSLTRIDLIQQDLVCWGFPQGVLDLIELSEAEFRTKAHLNDQENLERRNQAEISGDFSVSFVDMQMVGGQRVFLALEFIVGLPVERLQRLNLLLSASSLHFRMREGGIGVMNLGNMVRFTAYPGPPTAPAGAWPAHHKKL